MFEVAELGRKVSKKEFDAGLSALRSALLEAQFGLKKHKIPVIIIISGPDCAGKGEFVHRLHEWLDPSGIETHALRECSDEEAARPRYWRFWRALPARGRIGIFFGSWYSDPIVDKVCHRIKAAELDGELDRIAFFERMLSDDGALIIKLWFHLGEKEQARRLKKLRHDPSARCRVHLLDQRNFKHFQRFIETSERIIRRTDSAQSPWHLIEASDRRYRELTSGQIILDAMRARLKDHVAPRTSAPSKNGNITAKQTVLDHVDLTKKLSDSQYQKELDKYQGRLTKLTWEARVKKISTVAVFEGWDASGKGSAIRRVTAAIDPRLYRIIPVAAPNDEERAHHYFWRFWRHLPKAGRVAIFDRSWYGRVLVERVEKFAATGEWKRAYLEINDFEEQLTENKIAIAKFWIHISKEEQLRRFKERQKIAFKRYKITAEDWRNRKKWDAYKEAVNDMVARTSTEFAPWTVVAGDDKHFARVHILKTLCAAITKLL